MAETSFPFENQSTSETQFSQLFRLLADTGVLGAATSSDLKPYGDSSGMFVKLPAGVAVVRGFYYMNDAVLSVAVPTASSTARTDSVILRLDPAANTVTCIVKAGSASGPPALTQVEAGVWEIRLADVTVPAGSTGVTAGQVTDRRSYTSLPWGHWTTDTRPSAPYRGKAGHNETSNQPEWWDGSSWRSFSTTTVDAGALTQGTLPNGRLDYGVVAAARGDRGIDAPADSYGQINGDWNQVLQPGVYRIWAGNTNTNAPTNAYLYGTLIVFGAGNSISSKTQIYCEHGNGGTVYTRTAWNGNDYFGWLKVANANDLTDIYNRLNNADNATAAIGNAVNARVTNFASTSRIASGNATVSTLTKNSDGNYSGYVDVTWPNITTLVSCVASARSADSRGVNASVTNQSVTGARIVITRPNNTATGVDWIAVGN